MRLKLKEALPFSMGFFMSPCSYGRVVLALAFGFFICIGFYLAEVFSSTSFFIYKDLFGNTKYVLHLCCHGSKEDTKKAT